jgi:hypothetical protein
MPAPIIVFRRSPVDRCDPAPSRRHGSRGGGFVDRELHGVMGQARVRLRETTCLRCPLTTLFFITPTRPSNAARQEPPASEEN